MYTLTSYDWNVNCIAFTGQVITVLTVVPDSKGYFAAEWVGNPPITID